MALAVRQLAVDADLVISHEHGEVLVTGSGDRLRVDVPGWPMGRWALGEMRRLAGSNGTERMDRTLKSCGLGVDVALGKHLVGRLGKDARPGLLDRALGFPLQVSYRELLRALVTRESR